MQQFALTRKAQSDLRAIAIFTEKTWSKAQRNLYLKQFDDAFHLLAANPFAGKSCDTVANGYRKLPQGSHVVFYKVGENIAIEIVRILHKSMDVDVQL